MRLLRHRLQRVFSFAALRLSPEGLFGLYFTIGAMVLVGTAWLFGGIAEDMVNGDPLVRFDALISEWFRTHASPRFAMSMNSMSALASATTVGMLFVLMGGVFLWQRQWYWLAGLLPVFGGGMLVNVALKNLFGRARPGWAEPLMQLADPGFPSGHAMMATIVYGFIAIYLMLGTASVRRRFFIAAMAIVLVLLVGLSRMYLGAHYLSDVTAGIAAGIAWLALCLTAMETLRRHRG